MKKLVFWHWFRTVCTPRTHKMHCLASSRFIHFRRPKLIIYTPRTGRNMNQKFMQNRRKICFFVQSFLCCGQLPKAIRPPDPPYNVSGVSRHHRLRTPKSKRMVYNIIVAKRIVSISVSGVVKIFHVVFLSGLTCRDKHFSGHLCPDKLRTFGFGVVYIFL